MATISLNDVPARPGAHYTVYELRNHIAEREELQNSRRLSHSSRTSARHSSIVNAGREVESVAINVESNVREEEVAPIVLPIVIDSVEASYYEGYSASRSDANGPVELITTISSKTAAAACYTDSTKADKSPPNVKIWVGGVVVAAFVALVLTSGTMVGWGARMGRSAGSRPLIAPLGEDPVLSRVLAALSSVSGVLVWVMIVAVCVAGRTIIERAARRPILPVFLEAVRNGKKLSKSTVRPGWRAFALYTGAVLGAGAGAALLAAASVVPASHVQRALFVTAIALIDAWAFFYVLAVGMVQLPIRKVLTLSLIAGILFISFGVYSSVYPFGMMRYYATPCAILAALFGTLLVFSSVAWQNRYEHVELCGIL